MTPEEIAKIQTKKMTLELDLNESQQKQVNALLLEEARNRAEKKEAYNKIKDNAEAKAALTKEDRVKMMNERLDNQIAMKAKMKNILNADQYAKWEQKMTQKTGKREGFKKKMQESKTSKD